MEIRYRWERNHRYMLINADNISADSYQFKMLEENQIYGLLKVRVQQINHQSELCYRITGRQPMGQRFGGVYLTEPYIKVLMAEINKAAGALEEYLLDLDSLLLEPEFIFWREQDDIPEFCYYPSEKPEKNFRERLRELLRYILDKTDHKNEQAVTLVYGMYRIGVNDQFRMQDFMQFLFYHNACIQKTFQSSRPDRENREPAAEDPKYYASEKDGVENSDLNTESGKRSSLNTSSLPVQKSLWLDRVIALMLVGLAAAAAAILISQMYRTWENGEIKDQVIRAGILLSVAIMTSAAVYRLLTAGNETDRKRTEETRQNVSEGEDQKEKERDTPDAMKVRESEENYFSVPWGSETSVLNRKVLGDGRIWFRYQGKENISDFVLEQDGQFLVGKGEKGADIILNWPTVSRKQAILRLRGGICTVEDCGSSNGTYLDKVRLIPAEPKVLLPGSIVKFAELSFLIETDREDETRLLDDKGTISF